jgi:hypothetical protein
MPLQASRSAPDLVAQLYESGIDHQWPRTPERTPSPEPPYRSPPGLDDSFPSPPVSPASDYEDVKSSSSSPTSPVQSQSTEQWPQLPFSLFDHLKQEVLYQDLDNARELKSERIANFLSVPMAIEQVLSLCLPPCCLADSRSR